MLSWLMKRGAGLSRQHIVDKIINGDLRCAYRGRQPFITASCYIRCVNVKIVIFFGFLGKLIHIFFDVSAYIPAQYNVAARISYGCL